MDPLSAPPTTKKVLKNKGKTVKRVKSAREPSGRANIGDAVKDGQRQLFSGITADGKSDPAESARSELMNYLSNSRPSTPDAPAPSTARTWSSFLRKAPDYSSDFSNKSSLTQIAPRAQSANGVLEELSSRQMSFSGFVLNKNDPNLGNKEYPVVVVNTLPKPIKKSGKKVRKLGKKKKPTTATAEFAMVEQAAASRPKSAGPETKLPNATTNIARPKTAADYLQIKLHNANMLKMRKYIEKALNGLPPVSLNANSKADALDAQRPRAMDDLNPPPQAGPSSVYASDKMATNEVIDYEAIGSHPDFLKHFTSNKIKATQSKPRQTGKRTPTAPPPSPSSEGQTPKLSKVIENVNTTLENNLSLSPPVKKHEIKEVSSGPTTLAEKFEVLQLKNFVKKLKKSNPSEITSASTGKVLAEPQVNSSNQSFETQQVKPRIKSNSPGSKHYEASATPVDGFANTQGKVIGSQWRHVLQLQNGLQKEVLELFGCLQEKVANNRKEKSRYCDTETQEQLGNLMMKQKQILRLQLDLQDRYGFNYYEGSINHVGRRHPPIINAFEAHYDQVAGYIREIDGKMIFYCPACSFSAKEELPFRAHLESAQHMSETHVRIVQQQTNILCENCNEKFRGTTKYMNHVMSDDGKGGFAPKCVLAVAAREIASKEKSQPFTAAGPSSKKITLKKITS